MYLVFIITENRETTVKRAAMNLGVGESTITALLDRFGFQEVPSQRHQWIRQPLRLGAVKSKTM